MPENYIYLRNKIIGFFYKYLLKPIFFLQDPETVHDRVVRLGKLLGSRPLTRKMTALKLGYKNKALEQTIAGIHFDNPIGLAAGFDKNAELTDIIPSVGFGFIEVGSITGQPCPGNPKPRLWRLPKSEGLVVYYGLKNDGAESISKSLKGKYFSIPVGISIAKTNSKETVELEAGINDYLEAAKRFVDIGDYLTINISCPNAFGGQPFHEADRLARLLSAIDTVQTKKPIFLKISPDLYRQQLDAIISVSEKHRISGFICTNLTKDRNNKQLIDKNIPQDGGISGKIMTGLSNKMISYMYQKTNGRYIIIGCGGVFSAEDAYQKIKAGASLIQLITGMIFEGPQVISQINQGLAQLLKKDGYTNISQAMGAEHRS